MEKIKNRVLNQHQSKRTTVLAYIVMAAYVVEKVYPEAQGIADEIMKVALAGGLLASQDA